MKKMISYFLLPLLYVSVTSCQKDPVEPGSDDPNGKWQVVFGASDIPPVGGHPNLEFIKDWENATTILRAEKNKLYPESVPWYTGSPGELPSSIRNDVKKEDGWTMAFCMMGVPKMPRINYFGLYNKYTGILRIFYFNDTSTVGGGNEWEMLTQWNLKGHEQPATLYHNLPMGLANDPEVKKKNFHLLTDAFYKSTEDFAVLATPWHAAETAMPCVGWTAADLDLSCYRNGRQKLSDKGVELYIGFRTSAHASITLKQVLSDGKKPAAGESVSTAAGIATIQKMNDYSWKFGDVIKDILDGKFYSAFKTGFGTLFSLLGIIHNDDVHAIKNTPLEFTGTFEAKVPNDMPYTSLSLQNFTVIDNAFEEGCWGLEQAPVMYFFKQGFPHSGYYDEWLWDRRYWDGEQQGWNITKRESWAQEDRFEKRFYGYIPLFLDPTSILPVINTDVFKNVTNATVAYHWGLYAHNDGGGHKNYKKDYTKPYSDLMGYGRVPLLRRGSGNDEVFGYRWAYGENGSQCVYHLGFNDNSGKPADDPFKEMRYEHRRAPWDDTKYPDEKSTSRNYFCDPQFLNGRCTEADEDAVFFVNPDMEYPSYCNIHHSGTFSMHRNYRTVLENQVAPEPVVVVTVSFKYTDDFGKQRNALFTKRFVPQVIPIAMNIVSDSHLAKAASLREASRKKEAWKNSAGTGQPFFHTTGDFMGCVFEGWMQWGKEVHQRQW